MNSAEATRIIGSVRWDKWAFPKKGKWRRAFVLLRLTEMEEGWEEV